MREQVPERTISGTCSAPLARCVMDVHVHNVTKTFGSLRANDNITLSFAAGQIHGVLGENGAGKSTLMKLLSGFLRRDSGEILLNGQPARLANPAVALAAGIGMIHQDPLDVPVFSALENFYCASPRTALPDMKSARAAMRDLSQRLDFALDPATQVARLTVGQRQQLEIMRLLACGAQVLILDEPTTGISAAQKEALFTALRQLASEGKTMLFVSHKLEDVADLCQTVSVLQAGKVMGEGQMPMPQPQERLLSLMFGQEEVDIQPQIAAALTEEVQLMPPTWALEDITVQEGARTLHNISFELPAGSVLGLSGLEGSGQQLVLRLLAGYVRADTGKLWLNGVLRTDHPEAAFRRAGIYYLPANRLAEGIIGALSLSDHFALEQSGSSFLVDRKAAQRAATVAIDNYNIKATPTTPLASLSGGNQQRAMLALLPEHCSGLLLDNPSRGLDVVSAQAVWQRLLARREEGTSLVFASADFDELLTYSDYILVFYGGRVSRMLPRATLDTHRLAELIGGVGFEAVYGKDKPATT